MILNYKYGLFRPENWDAECEQEIRLQDTLWNELVEIETLYRHEVETTIRQDDPYREAAERLEAISVEIDGLLAEQRTQRKAARARIATPQLDEQLDELFEQRRKLWEAIKPLRRAAYRANRDELKELADERWNDIATARRDSGLWWGNYNAVVQAFDGTLRRIEAWQSPRPIEGERVSGRLTVQIQRGVPAPAFMAGARSEARVEMDDAQWRRRGSNNWRTRRAMLTATVHAWGQGDRKTATWPMLVHRPLPDGAVVKQLIITRRRPVPTARNWKWECTITIDIPDPVAVSEGFLCGIDLGWRKVMTGVRVATIADSAGGLMHVVLPNDMMDRRAMISALQGRIEVESREAGKDKKTHPDWRRLTLEIARWNRRRRDIYRVAAAELVGRCRLIGIDSAGIASMAKNKRRMPPETRRMRTWAAPAELAASVRDAARREGVLVREIEGPSTLVCHHCGHHNEVSEADRLNLIWRCQGCKSLWDQDENAAKNCLAAVTGVATEVVVKSTTERRRPPRLTRKKPKSEAQPSSE